MLATISSSPTLWGLLSQLATSAVAVPVYCFTHGNNRALRPQYAAIAGNPAISIVLGHVLGFAVPAIMMFDPFKLFDESSTARSLWALAFNFFPLGTAISSRAVSHILRLLPSSQQPQKTRAGAATKDGYNTVQAAYTLIGTISAVFHAVFLVFVFLGSVGYANGPIQTMTTLLDLRDSEHLALAKKVLRFLVWDYVVTFMALLAWVYNALVALYPSKRLRTAGLLLTGSVAFGPGAAAAVAWSIRETELASRERKSA